jgi:hypothetical protein
VQRALKAQRVPQVQQDRLVLQVQLVQLEQQAQLVHKESLLVVIIISILQ